MCGREQRNVGDATVGGDTELGDDPARAAEVIAGAPPAQVVLSMHFLQDGHGEPSRAAFLTGRYNHLNGIASNFRPFPTNNVTHPTLLRALANEIPHTSTVGEPSTMVSGGPTQIAMSPTRAWNSPPEVMRVERRSRQSINSRRWVCSS